MNRDEFAEKFCNTLYDWEHPDDYTIDPLFSQNIPLLSEVQIKKYGQFKIQRQKI